MLVDLIGFLVAAAFGGWLVGLVVSGLRTGRIHHTDSTSTFTWRTQPVRFTLVAVFFATLAAMLIYLAAVRATAIWHSLVA
jgi:hypothetical protein